MAKRHLTSPDSRTHLAGHTSPSHVSKYTRAGSTSPNLAEWQEGQSLFEHHLSEGAPSPVKLACRGTTDLPVRRQVENGYLANDPNTFPQAGTNRRQLTQCLLPPHPVYTFEDVFAFERHYSKEHTFRCSSCGANFPDGQLLDVHLSDRHDPIMAARRDRDEKTFICFVASCDKLCKDPSRRRLHLIDKHLYPRDYDFHIVVRGLKPKQTSMLRPDARHRVGSLSGNATRGNNSVQSQSRRRDTHVTTVRRAKLRRGLPAIMPDSSGIDLSSRPYRRGEVDTGISNGESESIHSPTRSSRNSYSSDAEEAEPSDGEEEPVLDRIYRSATERQDSNVLSGSKSQFRPEETAGSATGPHESFPSVDIEALTQRMGVLRFVPASVTRRNARLNRREK